MATKTREIKVDGFDLVMVPERGDEWMCSVYRTGKQVPLRRKLIEGGSKAEKWLRGTATKEAGR